MHSALTTLIMLTLILQACQPVTASSSRVRCLASRFQVYAQYIIVRTTDFVCRREELSSHALIMVPSILHRPYAPIPLSIPHTFRTLCRPSLPVQPALP